MNTTERYFNRLQFILNILNNNHFPLAYVEHEAFGLVSGVDNDDFFKNVLLLPI